MAISAEIEAKLVAYVLRHASQSYRELSRIIGVSDTTISRIMLKHGHRRIAPAETIDVSKLEVA
jgi:DNA-binding Lrp family transcriptional regulator